MSNLNPSQLTAWTGAIDIANDLVMVWKNANSTLYKATPNQLANLTSQWVGTTDTQALTNKTLTAPAISAPTLSGTVTGTYTLGGTPTFPAAVVTLTGSQTLTNKILTSPTINSPTITNATISADALTGFSTSNIGTLYGVSFNAGTISGTANNWVTASMLATNAITLGYVQITSTVTLTTPTSDTQVTGMTITVTIPAGGRRVKITAYTTDFHSSTANSTSVLSIWDGTVGSGTELQQWNHGSGTVDTDTIGACVVAVVTPPAASKTYNVGAKTASGNAVITAAATSPAFVLVEVI